MSSDRPRARASRRARGWSWWPFRSVLVVVFVGLLVTGVLTWVSSSQYTDTEKRLLQLRAHDVGTVLTAVLPSIQTPLASAVELADATAGSTAKFRQFMARYVGQGSGRPFVSASLWRTSDPGRGPLVVVGAASVLAARKEQAQAFLARAARSSGLSVIGLLGGSSPRLGYAFTAGAGPFVAYGASALPANRYAPVPNNSAFSDLDYALYLGASTNPAGLLVASVRRLPLSGRHTTVRVPFASTFFTVTVAARRPLAGSLPQRLPWAIAIVGTLLSLGAGALTGRLIDRRRGAEELAGRLEEIATENRRLYGEQRGIARTLQRALLPQKLPHLPGLRVSARYEAGVEGVEIGGDWYDLIALDEHRLLLVMGDVSGKGLRAATTMASLRFAVRAYAAQGDAPAVLLSKLSALVNVNSQGQIATVLCAMIDAPAYQMTVTSAGHLPALLIRNGRAELVQGEVGLPVGVDPDARYESTTVSVPAGATLLAFTDGLVERRGETIDTGLERLRARVSYNHDTLDQLLTQVVDEQREQGASDDTAIAAIQWLS